MSKNEKEVGLLLHRLGVSSKYCGFEFLSSCVTILLENESYRHKSLNFLYEDLAKKFNWKKVVTVIINIILLISAFFYFLFIGLGLLGGFLFWDTTPREPKAENYVQQGIV